MKKCLSLLVAVLILFTSIVTLSSCGNNGTTICVACGAKNSADVKFCSNCGNAFDSSETYGDQNNNESQNNNTQNNNGEATISTAQEFFNKIASNSTISLSNITLSIGNVTGINNPCVEKSKYGYYLIKNVENLAIIGSGTTISSAVNNETYFIVFDNCKNVTISGVNFNSSSYNEYFYTTFLNFENCVGVTIKDCDFDNFGEGISFYKSESAIVEKCDFNNLGYAMSLLSSKVSCSQCSIKASAPFYCSQTTLSVCNSNISEVESSFLIWDDTADIFSGKTVDESTISFTNCDFKNNTIESLFAKNVLGKKIGEDYYDSYVVYEHNKLKFSNCNFNNNLYCYGSLATNNFVDCTFSNNEVGIKIPNITGWGESYIESEFDGLDYSIEFVYEDIETNLVYPSATVVAQSKKGVVSKTDSYVVLTVSKPAITLEYIDWDINSAGGVEPDVKFVNNTDKQIAYVYFKVKYYDRMGTPAYCSIKDICEQRWKVTGPINAGATKTTGWKPTIYNNTIGAIKPLSIEIIFTDGTKQVITNTGGYWYSGSYYGGELKD